MTRVTCGAIAIAALALTGAARTAAGQVVPEVPAAVSAVQEVTADVEAVRRELHQLKNEFEALRRRYDERLLALEQRLGQMTGGPRAIEVVAAAPQDAAEPPPAPVARASTAFNPDTSVIGNFVGTGGRHPFSTDPPLQLSEAEVAFQSVVDPYAKANFYLAAGPEGVELEEGYVTFTSLPSNLLLKAGKMRASFGKVNALHTHAMPTVDRPLLTQNLMGGEEGLSGGGLSLSWLLPNPHVFLEATGEVFAGRSGVFSTDARSRLNYVGHVRAYRDITEDLNLEIGSSAAVGPTEGLTTPSLLVDPALPTTFSKRMFGIDATFRYRPLRRAIYRRLNLRTEMVWSREDLPSSAVANAFGIYGLGEYQFARRWYAGARFDRSGRAFDASLVDTGGSVFVTFWPTEFSQIRSQYRRTNYGEGRAANELFFQLNFSIGAHGAHAF